MSDLDPKKLDQFSSHARETIKDFKRFSPTMSFCVNTRDDDPEYPRRGPWQQMVGDLSYLEETSLSLADLSLLMEIIYVELGKQGIAFLTKNAYFWLESAYDGMHAVYICVDYWESDDEYRKRVDGLKQKKFKSEIEKAKKAVKKQMEEHERKMKEEQDEYENYLKLKRKYENFQPLLKKEEGIHG